MKKDRWSPYLVGIGIGLLSIFCFFFFNKMLGSSTAFVRLAAFLEYLISPEHVADNAYYKSYLDNNAWIDWQIMLVIGIFIGALIASKMTSSKERGIPMNFENSKKSFLIPLVGGFILLFGARLAGGCTSGHAVSGGMQLSLTSWIFMLTLFATAIPTAKLLYRRQ